MLTPKIWLRIVKFSLWLAGYCAIPVNNSAIHYNSFGMGIVDAQTPPIDLSWSISSTMAATFTCIFPVAVGHAGWTKHLDRKIIEYLSHTAHG